MPLRITLGDLLHESAGKFADRPFLAIAETGLTLSYHEFETLTNRFAHGLIGHFHDSLSYVAILAENGVEYLAASYALKKVNAIEVSINDAMRGAPLARMIDQTEARVLITSGVHLDALNQIRNDIGHLRTLIMIDAMDKAQDLSRNSKSSVSMMFCRIRIIILFRLPGTPTLPPSCSPPVRPGCQRGAC